MRGADPKQAAALSVQALGWPEACLCLRVTQKGKTAGREVPGGAYKT